MTHAPRRFGRARRLSLARRVSEIALDATFAGGWAARLSHRLRLDGRLVVSEDAVTMPRWRGDTPLRVAFASDFHAGPTTDARQFEAACQAIEQARPDLILFGGDFVQGHCRHVEPLARRLAALAAPLGKFAVLGNHDLYADDAYVVDQIERAGIHVLVNESARLPAPYDGLVLCGMDDPVEGHMNAAAALGDVEDGGARLIMMHAPEGFLRMPQVAFDLALCGHTHGGQVALPNGFPLRMPGPWINRRYSRGRFELRGGATLIVSRGIGCSMLPIRLFAPPEVHVLTLEPGLRVPASGRSASFVSEGAS